MIKQKRKEKAGKWAVPLPKVRGIAEEEMFKVIKTGKRRSRLFFFKKNPYSIIFNIKKKMGTALIDVTNVYYCN